MRSRLLIVLYVIFTLLLYLFESRELYFTVLLCLAVLTLRLPSARLKAGWLPISLFLVFTFLSNVLNRHGKILVSAGPLLITEEGLLIASLKTARVLFMIWAAKLLMAAAGAEDLLKGLGELFSPLERLGLPVADFFHTMGLTLRCFPILKDRAQAAYRDNAGGGGPLSFRARAKIISSFLLPFFVESVRAPEAFFEKESKNGQG